MSGFTETAKLLVEMKADITARNACDDVCLLHTSAFCPAHFLHRAFCPAHFLHRAFCPAHFLHRAFCPAHFLHRAFCPAHFLHRSQGATALGFAFFTAEKWGRDTAAMVAYLRSIGVPEGERVV
jgi:hypothetical protein